MRHFAVSILLIWASVLVSIAAAATPRLEHGLAAVDARDFRTAVRELSSALNGGGLSALEQVAAFIARGRARVELMDDNGAADDFEKALALAPNAPDGNYYLGLMALTGRGTYKDEERAKDLLEKAAQQDHRAAQRELARLYLGEKFHDPKASHRWLMTAARAGDAVAMRTLGSRYEHGIGLILNLDEAFRWYMKAAELGDAPARYNVAMAYGTGQGTAQDPDQYRQWIEKAAEGGFRDAAFRVGEILADGRGVPRDVRAGACWFWRAASLLHQQASVRLGLDYLEGQGVASNFEHALYWFERAGDDPQALYERGFIREKGLVGDADPRQAFEFYRKAAQRGVVEAIVRTGMMYMTGYGVAADTKAGTRYLHALAGLTSANGLNAAAWMLATDQRDEIRSGKLAATLIGQAIDKAGERPELLDTEAAVYAERGKFRQAVKSQKKALKALEDDAFRSELEAHLARYEREEPWRVVFTEGHSEGVAKGTRRPGRHIEFTGTIVRLREALGVVDPGLFIDEQPSHVVDIAVRKVEKGTLPFGLTEHLVLFVEDPVHYFPAATSETAVTDYPLELQRFSLDEVEEGGWHYDLRILGPAEG